MNDNGAVAFPDEWIVAFQLEPSSSGSPAIVVDDGHCFAFGWTPAGWLYVEPRVIGPVVGILPENTVLGFFTAGKLGKLKLLCMKPLRASRTRPRLPGTATGHIGAMLRLKRLPATPKGLANEMQRMGARIMGRPLEHPGQEPSPATSSTTTAEA